MSCGCKKNNVQTPPPPKVEVVENVMVFTPQDFNYTMEDINRCWNFFQNRPYPQEEKDFVITLHNNNFSPEFPLNLNQQTPDWSVLQERIRHLKTTIEDYERKKTGG
jgi:hypothetical protein